MRPITDNYRPPYRRPQKKRSRSSYLFGRVLLGVLFLVAVYLWTGTDGNRPWISALDFINPEIGSHDPEEEMTPSTSDFPPGRSAVVERVVDGDTLIADIEGERTRIRLLNIDTPETGANSAPECLGQEATETLRMLAPQGSRIRLEFDRGTLDQYDRTLAGIYTEAGLLINAAIAREGLARVVVFDGNTRFLEEVRAADAEAQQQRRGLHEPGACP